MRCFVSTLKSSLRMPIILVYSVNQIIFYNVIKAKACSCYNIFSNLSRLRMRRTLFAKSSKKTPAHAKTQETKSSILTGCFAMRPLVYIVILIFPTIMYIELQPVPRSVTSQEEENKPLRCWLTSSNEGRIRDSCDALSSAQ